MQEIGFLAQSKVFRVSSLSIFLILFLTVPSVSSQKLEQPLHARVLEGINKILLQDYEGAFLHFQKIAKEYPDHPVGYLYQIAAMESRAMDLEFQTDEHLFDSLLTISRKLARSMKQPWQDYFLGLADGYESYYAAERQQWIKAVRCGSSSAGFFESVLARDSTFYDAYVGLGTYYFWRDQKTLSLNWLPFISDRREEAISMLKVGAERSEYNRYSAISTLISIFLETARTDEARQWSQKGLEAFPHNRIFLWGLATALDRGGKSSEAVKAYERLLQEILADKQAHPYNEIVCRLNLSKLKIAVNDTNDVRVHLEQILAYKNFPFPKKYQDRARKKFDEAERLLSQLK